MMGPTKPTRSADRLARSVSLEVPGRAYSRSSAVARTRDKRGTSEGPLVLRQPRSSSPNSEHECSPDRTRSRHVG